MELTQIHKLFNSHVYCSRQKLYGKLTFCDCPDGESADYQNLAEMLNLPLSGNLLPWESGE